MKIIKTLVKNILASQGYSVVKNEVPKPVVYNAYFRGGCLKCFKGDPLCEEILLGIGWDEQLEDIISESIKNYPNLPCVEVGANIGAGFITLARRFGSVTFDCYEPVPRFFNLLKLNHESFDAKNANLFNEALSNESGNEIEIAIGLGTAGRPETDGKTETIKLKTKTIDELYLQKGISFLKLDVDGYELSVLCGAKEVLQKYRPYVFMEFDTKLMKKVGEDPTDILKFFKNNNYSSVRIWDNFSEFLKECSNLDEVISVSESLPHYANVLFVP